jgi:TetR/AcrR family transcriptional regulator, cholesterol catabolism regulator
MEDKSSRERILTSARELFQRYGIRSITMDDIAHHLGISKKTIYQHFSDKDDIVTLSMRHHIGAERTALLELKKQSKDALDLLIRIHHYLQKNLTHSTSALLFDLQKYHSKAWDLLNEFRYDFVGDFVRTNLETGIEQGFFRDDMNIEIVTKIRLEEIMLAHNDSVFPRDQFNAAEVSSSILEHFIFAITTDRGKKLYKKYREATNKNGLFKTHEA